MSSSVRLSLPYLAASQAQKHVTHNEALLMLDVLVQLSVEDVDAETPPEAPEQGEVWALGLSPTGAWADNPLALAAWIDAAWVFFAPQPGWLALNKADSTVRTWSEQAWVTTALPPLNQVDGIGVNTSFDATNRLAVASEASLFSHAGAGHQLKVNKETPDDTASLLFQTGWSGRAEMGLAGSDAWSLKVSVDGVSWIDALSVSPGTGHVTGAAIQQSASDITAGRLARADFAYSAGNVVGPVSEAAGLPTGAVIESGSNANGYYARFADGTQICATNSLMALNTNASLCSVFWSFPATFIDPPYGTQVIVDGDEWNDLAVAPTVSRGDIVPFRGNQTKNGMTAQVWARSGISFDPADAVPLSTMAIGRWY